MAKTSMKLKQARTPKFSTRAYNRKTKAAAVCAAVPTLSCASTACAVSASVSWPTRARFRACARPAGNRGEKRKEVPTWL